MSPSVRAMYPSALVAMWTMTFRKPLRPELTEVVIEVLVQHDTPAASRNGAKDAACRPLSVRSAIRKARDQVTQAADVGLPRRWTRGQELGRALSLPFRPRHDVDR